MNDRASAHEIERIAELARAAAPRDASEAQRRMLRARFLERAESAIGGQGERRYRWVWAACGVAAALAAVLLVISSRALRFEVEGSPRDGSYVRASADRPALLRFSDDTLVRAAPSSRLRVEETGAHHARVLVERGKADVHVVPDVTRRWTFVAGPFEVLVTGTRFSLEWEPEQERFELSLLEGSVEIRGEKGSGPVVVRAGQRFVGDVKRGSMAVLDARGDAHAAEEAPPSEPRPAASAGDVADRADSLAARPRDAAAPPEPRKERGAKASPAGSDWQARITRGDFAGIVASAEQRGIPSCLRACSAAELRSLSDAARYTGKSGLAEQSLLALRSRFGSSHGRDAAFLLGRLEEQRGSAASAERWYATYLGEAPGGAFAAEALAGKMRVTRTLRGKRAAEPIARAYLQRFPRGVHIATAREILGQK